MEDAIPEIASLLDRAAAGDGEAFGEVCLAYEAPLFRQAMALCGNPALAEDLAQDTLVEAWKYLRRYDGRCQFFTWLCAILLNRYRNFARRRYPRPFSALLGGNADEFQRQLEQAVDREPLPDQAALRNDQSAVVRRCIAALPPKQQQVIHLRFFVDDSIAGIAAALGCSAGTVKSRLFNALENLRAMPAMRGRPINIDSKPATL